MDEIYEQLLAENQPPELTMLSKQDIIDQSCDWPAGADFEEYEKRMILTFI